MTNYKYFGYRCTQRTDPNTVPFFVFCARSKQLEKWIGIRRTKEVPKGNQRILRPARKRAIKYFLESENINTIPNNILVAFDKDKAKFSPIDNDIAECIDIAEIKNGCEPLLQWGFLEFENDDEAQELDKAAFLVDGQHRLFGISSFEKEDIPILVVSLLGADHVEQAFQFIVVNNKQVKVPTDNIKSIIADLDTDALERRVTKAGVKYGDHSPLLKQLNDLNSSPFKNLLTWDYNREKEPESILVPVTAIEQSLRFLQETFDFLKEDTDTLLEIFISIWSAIAETFSELWNKEKKFMKKVNIDALNELISINLKTLWKSRFIDIFETSDIKKAVTNYFQEVPKDFWLKTWQIKIQDNSNVRNLILADLDRIKENVSLENDWMDGLSVPARETSSES